MLQGSLNEPGNSALLEAHPVWKRACDWLRTLPPDAPLGTVELSGADVWASIQEYTTLRRQDARFESHREYVDLQFTLSGGEFIEWCPRQMLLPEGPFENDVQFWQAPTGPTTALGQTAQRFAIFYPEDAHRPKVAMEGYPGVRKLVIKIRRSLIP